MFCQNCGKELPDDAKFCQYCGAKIEKNDVSKEGTAAKIEKVLEEIKSSEGSGKGGIKLGDILGTLILVIGVIVFTCGGCSKKDNQAKSPNEEYTAEQKTNLMKITNDFAVAGLNNGTFKKVEKIDDGQNCSYLFWTEERLWEILPYEDKQNAKELIRHYAKVRGCFGALFKGYRTGKYL